MFPTLFIGSLAAFNCGHARGEGKVVEIKSLSLKSSHGLMFYIGSGILLLEVLLEVSLRSMRSLNVQKNFRRRKLEKKIKLKPGGQGIPYQSQ